MPLFDSHTREQLRQTYADAWRKHLAHSPLTPLEAMITDVIGAHPEYQPMVSDAQAALNRLRFEAHAARLLNRAAERQRELDLKKAAAAHRPAEP